MTLAGVATDIFRGGKNCLQKTPQKPHNSLNESFHLGPDVHVGINWIKLIILFSFFSKLLVFLLICPPCLC